MSVATVRRVVCRMGPDCPPTDAELVAAIAPVGAERGAEREAAFVELLGRYGPMVLGVCRRILSDTHDAEDAFQAAFLVLARKAGTIRPPGAVGGWLYGVAVRTARKAKTAAARRRRREMATAEPSRVSEPVGSSIENAELRAVIDAELAALPDSQRAAIVLCDLHGKTRAEVAAELNRPEGTVAAWLARGRKTLAARLARRGVTLPAAGLVAVFTPAAVSATAISAAVATFLGRGVSVSVLALAESVMKSLSSTSTKLAAVVVTVGSLLAAVATATAWYAAEPNPAAPAAIPVVAAAAIPKPEPAPNPAPPAGWKETKVLDLTGWLGGSVTYSADGKVLFVGGTDGHVRAYDTVTWKQLWEHKDGGKFAALAVAPDGKTLAITTKDGVQFLDAATGKAGDALEVKGSESLVVAFFPDTPLLDNGEVIATNRKVIFGNAREYHAKMWLKWPQVSTIKSSVVAAGKKPADDHAIPLAVDPGGKRVVVTGPLNRDTGKNVLWAWSAGSGEGNKLLEGHKAAVVSAAWSKNGKVIVTGDADGLVITWDAATFKEKSQLKLGGRVAALAVSPDGIGIAAAVIRPAPAPGAGAYSEDVFTWLAAIPPEKPEPISSHQAGAPFSGVASVAFAPDGKTLVSCFTNFDHLWKLGDLVGKVRIFSVKPVEPEKPAPAAEKPAPEPEAQKWTDTSILEDHGHLVNGVAVAPDGKSFTAATEGNVICWDMATRMKLWVHKPTDSKVFALAFSPDGKYLCIATTSDVMRLDAKTGKPDPWTDPGVTKFGPATAVAYSPDGKWLALADGWRALVFPAEGGKSVLGVSIRATGDGPVLPCAIAWAPDGKRLAVPQRSEKDGWRVSLAPVEPKPGAAEVLLVGHTTTISAVAWSKDGTTIASGDVKGAVLGWNVVTGKELWRKKFAGRDETDGRINALSFSPADNTLATAVSMGSGKAPERVVLLAGESGKDVALIARWPIPVSSVAWSNDGKFLVTGCGAAGRVIDQKEVAIGEVVVWERKP